MRVSCAPPPCRPAARRPGLPQVAKAISGHDGQAYALRRVDGRQVIPTAELVGAAEEAVARWEPLAGHPNLVGLREAFASDEWDGSPSLFFVHDYHPGPSRGRMRLRE